MAAPHGGFDWATEDITLQVAERLQWSYVIANGFRSFEKPINVNRPTEGVRIPFEEERHTDDAMLVFQQYSQRVHDLNPQFYVEIHGATLIQSRIEIALNGITVKDAARIKSIFQSEVNRRSVDIAVAVEGIDNIHYRAPGAKRWGVLGRLAPALHIELPPELRGSNLQPTVEILSQALSRIADVLYP